MTQSSTGIRFWRARHKKKDQFKGTLLCQTTEVNTILLCLSLHCSQIDLMVKLPELMQVQIHMSLSELKLCCVSEI